MNILIVIPARGGSKGIPKKNIYPLNGKPLLQYTLDVIKDAHLNNMDTVVSTDSDEIKAIALKTKGIFVVKRPAEISGDTASTEAALLHAIQIMEKDTGKTYDTVLTLQVTSPLREAVTLKNFIHAYQNNYPQYDAMLSLNETTSDYWVPTDGGGFERLQKEAPRRRQGRKPLYVENSAYYITNINALKKTHSILGTSVNAFIISAIEGIDINEPEDIIIAKSFLELKSQRSNGIS